MSDKVRYPFGPADEKVLTATGAQALTIVDGLTLVDGVTTEATGNRTLDLTLDVDLRKGDKLVVRSQTAGTQTLTFGTGITGAVVTGVAGTIITRTATFDGVEFKVDNEQIN